MIEPEKLDAALLVLFRRALLKQAEQLEAELQRIVDERRVAVVAHPDQPVDERWLAGREVVRSLAVPRGTIYEVYPDMINRLSN